jgi:hypothetical protein
MKNWTASSAQTASCGDSPPLGQTTRLALHQPFHIFLTQDSAQIPPSFLKNPPNFSWMNQLQLSQENMQISPLNNGASIGAILSPRGHLALSSDIFGWYNWRGEVSGIKWMETRDAIQHPTVHRYPNPCPPPPRPEQEGSLRVPTHQSRKLKLLTCNIEVLISWWQFHIFPVGPRVSQGQGCSGAGRCFSSSSRCLAHGECSINIGRTTEWANEGPDGLMKHDPGNWVSGRPGGSLNGYCIRKFQLQGTLSSLSKNKSEENVKWIQSQGNFPASLLLSEPCTLLIITKWPLGFLNFLKSEEIAISLYTTLP